MVQTFKSDSNRQNPTAISYFTSFQEAEKFFEERGGKFFDFSDVNVCISGERYFAAVEHAAE